MTRLSDAAVKNAKDELTDYTIYKMLSESEEDSKMRRIFSDIAAMERRHYAFWLRYCGGAKVSADAVTVNFMLVFRRLLGEAFVIKHLEGTEAEAIKKYEGLRSVVPKSGRRELEQIINDESGHEQAFAQHVQEAHVRYISFIVLGLADALVEIAGIHAGSLGIYASTFLTGLAGVIAGAAASLSMASAAFAQAKQGFPGSARTAASYTGISYFVAAVILASPYFLTHDSVMAIFVSLILGMIMIGFVSWYNGVISGKGMRKDFSELAAIMLGATILLFFVGLAIRHVFGITI